jgi:hypothetical protein
MAVALIDLSLSPFPFPFFNSGCNIQQHSSVCPPGLHLVHVYQLNLGFPHKVKLVDIVSAGPLVCCVDERKVVLELPVRQSLLSIIRFWTVSGEIVNKLACVARPISMARAMSLLVMVFLQSASSMRTSWKFFQSVLRRKCQDRI